MKYTLYILIVLQVTIAKCQPEQEVPERIIYTEQTRGFQTELEISSQQIKLVRKGLDPVEKKMATPEGEWQELLRIMKQLDDGAWNEQGGQHNMASDRAPGARLIVHFPGKKISSPTWSSDEPPSSIQPLLERVQSILKVVESQD